MLRSILLGLLGGAILLVGQFISVYRAYRKETQDELS